MSKPWIFVAVDDADLREQLIADLERRFAADYLIRGAGSAEALGVLLDATDPIACVIAASDDGESISGVDLLVRVHEVHHLARRVLLVRRGQWRGHPVRRAMVLGQVDSYLFIPWHPLEQWLYLPMSEYLAGWSGTQVPEHPAIRIVGEQWAESSHALRDVLSRSNIPYEFHAHDSREGQSVLESANQDGSRLPVLQFFTGVTLVDPTPTELVEALGFRSRVDGVSCDIAIIGAGPSGMSAAVYAGSEGLRTALVEPGVPGGQAGTSSMIRNYLGFPRGLSGADLTNRAIEQAWLLGTEIILAQEVVSLRAEGDERVITSADGGRLVAGAVVIATGVSWRRLGVPGVESLLGSGVFYGAAGSESEAMEGKRVYVVGGGNSAGQAAIHLAKYAESTTIVIRRDSLRHTMSDYLIQEIEALPNVEVRTNTEIVDGCGRGRLEELILRDRLTNDVETVAASGLFVMIGGEPRTDWLAGTLARDDRGYLLTGADIGALAASRAGADSGVYTDGAAPPWPLKRPPGFVETSMPGVFAVGDVRHGSTKRIAPSVGAGGIAVQLAHEYLSGLRSR